MKKKNNVNNTAYIIIGVVVLLFIGGLVGSSITGNSIWDRFKGESVGGNSGNMALAEADWNMTLYNIMYGDEDGDLLAFKDFRYVVDSEISTMSLIEVKEVIKAQNVMLNQMATAVCLNNPDSGMCSEEEGYYGSNSACSDCISVCAEAFDAGVEDYVECKGRDCCGTGGVCTGIGGIC